MAMRTRGGGVNPNRPRRAIVGRVYEQFKPMSEWRQEDDYDTLLVYLPGFQKEFIKVTTEDRSILRVRGERFVAGNKWSQFQEDFQVPETCEMKGIRAKFDGGILTVTMPRKIINVPTTTTTQVAPKAEEPLRRAKQGDDSETSSSSTQSEDETTKQGALKSAFDPTEKPARPQTTPQPLVPTSSSKQTQQQQVKSVLEANAEKQKNEKQDVEQLNDQGKITQKGVTRKTSLVDQVKEQEPLVKARNVEKKVIEKRDADDARGKSKVTEEESGGGFRSDKLEDYKNVIKGVAMGGMKEERELLVNMGVAVLVIMALGAYLSYTIGSSSKGK